MRVKKHDQMPIDNNVLGVRLDPNLRKEIEQEAERDDRPISSVLRRVIAIGWAEYKKRQGKAATA